MSSSKLISSVYGETMKYSPTKVSAMSANPLHTSTSDRYSTAPVNHKGYRSKVWKVNEKEWVENHFGGDIIWRNRIETTSSGIEKDSTGIKKDLQRTSTKTKTGSTKIETDFAMKKSTTMNMSKN